MGTLNTIELKVFVPAKEFELSKKFYQDLGFTIPWSDNDLAYMHHGNASFLLQNFYVKELADNFMMHLLVEDVDAWWLTCKKNKLHQNTGCGFSPLNSGHGKCATSYLSIHPGSCGASQRTRRERAQPFASADRPQAAGR